MRCHHAPAEARRTYVDATGSVEGRPGSARGHNVNALSERAMSRPDARRMIRRRAAAAGIMVPIGCHTFRAAGIPSTSPTAAHQGPHTIKLYDRTKELSRKTELQPSGRFLRSALRDKSGLAVY
jgi:hypothetical protein